VVPKPSDHGPEHAEADQITMVIVSDNITHINIAHINTIHINTNDFGPNRRSDHLFRVLFPRTWRGLRIRQQYSL